MMHPTVNTLVFSARCAVLYTLSDGAPPGRLLLASGVDADLVIKAGKHTAVRWSRLRDGAVT
jgi:hypothetical protein